MKTVFITAFTNFVVRNILDTDFLKILKNEKNLRIIILASQDKKDYLEKNFGSENVTVEGVLTPPLTKGKIFFSRLSRMLLDTYTIRLFLRLRLNLKNPLDFLEYWFSRLIAASFGRSQFLKELLRKFDYFFLTKSRFRIYFERYRPDLVFSTDITDLSGGDSDIDLLREAKYRKVKTIGMVRSWDNLAARGVIRQIPDRIIVHNTIIKQQCIDYNGVAPEDVIPIGIPHYDRYLRARPSSRKDFFQKLDFDPQKKLILFVPIADGFLRKQFRKNQVTSNRYILELLSQLDSQKIQILVRFPLIGGVDLGDFKKPANMIFDYPERLFKKGELDRAADNHLIDSLYHSDLILPGPSTIALDALFFGKPIAFIAFDREKNLSFDESIKKFLEVEHLKPLMALGASRTAKSEKELFNYISQYLENPGLDSENRKKVLEKICWKIDGRSGERLAKLLEPIMKICYLNHDLKTTTGAGRFYNFFTAAVKKVIHGIDIEVLTMEDILRPNKLKLFLALPLIRKILKRCDIIHALDCWPYGAVAALALFGLNKKLVITAIGTGAVQPLYSWWRRLILKWAYRRANAVVAVSNNTKKEILKIVPDLKIEVINHGVNFEKFQGSSIKYQEIEKLKPYILSVGALKKRKGYEYSIAAFAEIAQKFSDLKYVIVGEGPEYGELKVESEKLKVAGRIKFFKQVEEDYLIALYKNAELFILLPQDVNKDIEGFGLVFLEAAACGLPVVAAKGTSAEDAVLDGKNGFLVPPWDSMAAAAVMERILQDKNLRAALSKESARFAKSMSWEKAAKTYADDIYNKL